MQQLSEEIINFFQHQPFVLVSTIDKDGTPHNACKGLVDIQPNGEVYLMDLYHAQTFSNLKNNAKFSIAAVDEHKFKGYCLKGRAKEIKVENLDAHLLKKWETAVTSRVATRVIRNLQGNKGHARHPEAELPTPKYLVVMEVKSIVDLTPYHLNSPRRTVEALRG